MSAFATAADQSRDTAKPRRAGVTEGLVTVGLLVSTAWGPGMVAPYAVESGTISVSPSAEHFVAAGQRAPSERIEELKELSGLTWEQLARVFGVTKRSLLHWRAGASLSAANDERLTGLLAELHRAGIADGDAGHEWLMSVDQEGHSPFLRWVEEARRDTPRRSWISRQPAPDDGA